MYLYSINLVIVLNYFIASSDTNDLRRKKASENPKAALHGPQRARLARRRVRHRKILKEKIEIGPTYAPHKKGSVTATKQQKEKSLPETKRREDPPRTRPSRRTSGNEASGDPPNTREPGRPPRTEIAERIQLVDNFTHYDDVKSRREDVKKPRFGLSKQR